VLQIYQMRSSTGCPAGATIKADHDGEQRERRISCRF
jgi:hypothetical protein